MRAYEHEGSCDVPGHEQPCGCEMDASVEVVRWILEGKYGYEDPVANDEKKE